MFGIGYYNDDDAEKKIVNLDMNYANFESARNAAKTLAKHPAFTNKTVGVIAYSQRRFYKGV